MSKPPSTTYNDSISPGLAGALPSGLTYNIGGDVYDKTFGSIDRTYQPDVGITLAQPLLRNFWIDSIRQQIWVSRKNLKISELILRLRIMDVVNRTEQAYYDLIFSQENVRVQQAGVELANRLLSENKRRVEVGALAPLDEQQAASQAAQSRADLLGAIRLLQTQENILKGLITDNYREWNQQTIQPLDKLVAVPEKFDLQESWQKGMTQRPDLLEIRVEVERSDINLRYTRNQLFPQLDLIGTYGRSGFAVENTLTNNTARTYSDALDSIRQENYPRYSYGAVFSIPLSNRGPRNRYKISKAEKEQSQLMLKQIEETVLIQIDDSVKQAQTSYDRIDATKQARLYAESALSAEQKKLENGKSTSFVVLQLQRDLTTARSEEIRALADYNKALAQLSFNEGTVFERNHLSMEIR
ncbi:MAG: TolC family protein [Verrucomicrobiota bacterium]